MTQLGGYHERHVLWVGVREEECEKTYLANFLENGHDEAQVANVKYRQREPDIAEMAIAGREGLVASVALRRFGAALYW